MSIREKLEKAKRLITEALDEEIKFSDKGNQAAGTRIRGSMQNLKVLAQEVRTEVQDTKNAGK